MTHSKETAFSQKLKKKQERSKNWDFSLLQVEEILNSHFQLGVLFYGVPLFVQLPQKRFVDETEILSFITILFPKTIFTIFYNFKTKEEGSHRSASLRVAKERGPPPSEEHRTPTRRFTIGRMG